MKNALRWLFISLVFFGCAKKSAPFSDYSGAVNAAARIVTFAPREEIIPNPQSKYAFCRPDSSVYSFSYCLNTLVHAKVEAPQQPLTILIQPGSHEIKDGLVILNVEQIEIAGVPDAEGKFPELLSANASLGRLKHQYFSFLVIDSANVTIRNLRLNGADILGQRAIGICATPAAKIKTKNIDLNHLSLSRYQGFNIMAGESLTTEHWERMAEYIYDISHPLLPMNLLARQLVDNQQAYCGGSFHNVSLSESEVRMKSVAFYLSRRRQSCRKR